jgi:glycosyltransferase involved in cell wall biosynthesis
MRVLHVYSGNLYGGIEAMLAAIARNGAPPCTHEFALCFDRRLAGELRSAGAQVHVLGDVRMSRPATIRRARRALARTLATQPYDCALLHAPWSHALFAGVVRRADVPVVFWAHDVMTGQHWTERLARRVVPDQVICNSDFTRTTLPALFHRLPPSAVVYPPVEVAAAPLPPSERAAVRDEFETGGDAVVIATACRSEAWKGHQLLVEALSRMRHAPDWTWWLIGGAQRPAEREYLTLLRRLADRHGIRERVRWIGERRDVARLLQAADV